MTGDLKELRAALDSVASRLACYVAPAVAAADNTKAANDAKLAVVIIDHKGEALGPRLVSTLTVDQVRNDAELALEARALLKTDREILAEYQREADRRPMRRIEAEALRRLICSRDAA